MFSGLFVWDSYVHFASFPLIEIDAGTTVLRAYETAPGLLAACALALIVPSLALVGGVVLASSRLLERMQARAERRRREARAAARPPSPTPTILLVSGQRRHDMQSAKTLTVIGRDRACDLRLEHTSIAEHHAAIERTADEELWLVDLTGPGGSGVRVDGRPVRQHRIAGGERIGIGEIELAVVAMPAEGRGALGAA